MDEFLAIWEERTEELDRFGRSRLEIREELVRTGGDADGFCGCHCRLQRSWVQLGVVDSTLCYAMTEAVIYFDAAIGVIGCGPHGCPAAQRQSYHCPTEPELQGNLKRYGLHC